MYRASDIERNGRRKWNNKRKRYRNTVQANFSEGSCLIIENIEKIVVIDLFCAGLTTICEMVLPMIMRYITNMGINDLAALSIHVVLRMSALYLVLRIIDAMANFYMAYTGHVMGTRMETDMRRDAYAHLQRLSDTYYNNTKVGQIMGRITNDLFDVTEFSHHCPEEFLLRELRQSFLLLFFLELISG